MYLPEFIPLSLEGKLAAILEQGIFLIIRTQGEHYVALYDMSSFFCEVWHDTATDKVLLAVGFEGTRRLEPYLQLIELQEL
ncbi:MULTISPECIES: hypothetical protein [Pontibacter]|uniref:Uncharacterized protein n=2 Tax=Pontibacter TaxID=323449 RepID=A0A5C8KE24_9BACT|nr:MULTISPECIES: hypothetical protein [Pontibacter]PVY38376.1 hypothetical protein C8E01_11776 [Pontibacter virosus]TXK50080.1 hypothetical protein FVR03_05625 [Pontibacter qinzhouensis]